VSAALVDLRRAAEGTDNLMPLILAAVKKRVTLGEMCNVLREVFGEYTHASHC
jgi:methylmalonyl-CoA mutase N-terminal domain/subunit